MLLRVNFRILRPNPNIMLRSVLIICFLIGAIGFSISQEVQKGNRKPVSPKSPPTVAQQISISGFEALPGGGSFYFESPLGELTGIYLTRKWQKGNARLKDGFEMDDCLFRFNIYAQQMQFIRDGDTAAFGDPKEIDFVRFGDSKFVYQEYLNNNVIEDGYFEVLCEGNCNLLLKRKILHYVKDEEDPSKDEYYLVQEYYLQEGDDAAHFIPLKKKEVIKRFGDHSNDVRIYIKKNDLKVNCCKDLIEVVEFYNSII